jgi:hypothetical protein
LLQRPGIALRLVCIATPHRGTLVAQVLPSPIGRDLRRGSFALARLQSAALPHDVVNIYTPHDNLVVPAASSELAGVHNHRLIGCGHMAMIYSPQVRDLLCAEIDRTRSAEPASSATT